MAIVTMNQKGGIGHIQPTAGDYEHDEAKKENAAAERQYKKAVDAANRNDAIQAKKVLSNAERMHACVVGLERLSKRAKRNGESNYEQVATAAKDATGLLQDFHAAEADIQAANSDPVTAAIEKAAKKLLKVFGSECLKNMAEARSFAKHMLPLTDARAQDKADHATRWHLDRKRQGCNVKFWAAIEKGAIMGGLPRDQTAIAELVRLGDV